MSLISGFEHIVRENEPLVPFTRLKLGGVAEYYAEPTSIDELVALVKRFSENEILCNNHFHYHFLQLHYRRHDCHFQYLGRFGC